MENCADFTCTPTPYEGVDDEQKLWDEILRQHGLSMTAGFIPNVLYGNDGQNALVPKFEYERPVTQGRHMTRNKQGAEKILALMQEGLSLRAAARKLNLHPFSAWRSLKRYKENFTRTPTSYEGEGDSDVR